MGKIILIFIIGGLIGMIFDELIRYLSNKNYAPDFKEWSKQKLNFFVYGSGFALIFCIYKIPCLQKINLLPLTIIFGSIILTGVELVFGLLFNVKLKLKIWDYTNMVFFGIKIPNFKGQISLLHGIIWGLLTPVVFNIINLLEKLL